MSFNNNVLFNAAFNGFLSGINSGAPLLDTTQADYANQTLAAVAFATAVDASIAHDANLSGSAGVTLPPTTALITASQYAKIDLVFGLSRSVAAGRRSNTYDTTTADYTTSAAGIFALYTEAVAALTTAGTFA